MASVWASTIFAAAILGLRYTALRCISLIMASSSSEALTELTPMDTISTPRRSFHLEDRAWFIAAAISSVWPGRAEYRMPISEIRAKAGCREVSSSDFS